MSATPAAAASSAYLPQSVEEVVAFITEHGTAAVNGNVVSNTVPLAPRATTAASPLLLRSGSAPAAAATTDAAASAPQPALNLARISFVESVADTNEVKVGAGALVGNLTNFLRNRRSADGGAAVLPLTLKQNRSVAAAVHKHLLKEAKQKDTFLQKSLGRLSSAITALEVINGEGQLTTLTNSATLAADYAAAIAADKAFTIVTVTFKPVPAASFSATSVTLPFSDEIAPAVLASLSAYAKSEDEAVVAALAKVDLRLEVFHEAYYCPMQLIRLTACTTASADLASVVKAIITPSVLGVEEASAATKDDVKVVSGGSAIAVVLGDDWLAGEESETSAKYDRPEGGEEDTAEVLKKLAHGPSGALLEDIATKAGAILPDAAITTRDLAVKQAVEALQSYTSLRVVVGSDNSLRYKLRSAAAPAETAAPVMLSTLATVNKSASADLRAVASRIASGVEATAAAGGEIPAAPVTEVTYTPAQTPEYTELCKKSWRGEAVFPGAPIAEVFAADEYFQGRIFRADKDTNYATGKSSSKKPLRPDGGYDHAIAQYAASSFVGDADKPMHPMMILYPKDVRSVLSALTFAKKRDLAVTVRSGGHQYCGTSSGGDKTLVISLDTTSFQRVFHSGDYVQVAPGTKLTNISRILMDNHLTVPHGECPFVCIGGHAQTGGYGHLLHSFGLCMDRVHSFDVILANGECRRVTRPASDSDIKTGQAVPDFGNTTDVTFTPFDDAETNANLFRSVLSGNAGSFGVVINYVFRCINADNYPKSRMFQRIVAYDPSIYTNLFKHVQSLTAQIEASIANNTPDTTTEGMDFTMTVSSTLCGALIVEAVHCGADVAKVPENPQFKPYHNEFAEFAKFVDVVDAPHYKNSRKLGLFDSVFAGFMNSRGGTDAETLLSVASHSFVREAKSGFFDFNSGTTSDGREFKYPYRKRVNCTSLTLPDGFIAGFVALVDKVLADKDVDMIMQMGMGGGAYKRNGDVVSTVGERLSITGIPHRDFTFLIVFDIFYHDGFLAKADAYQAEMQALVDTYLSPKDRNKAEQRVFWGTFENIKMDEAVVQSKYYDDVDEQYAILRDAKLEFDPENRFRTQLTVRPAAQRRVRRLAAASAGNAPDAGTAPAEGDAKEEKATCFCC